MIQFDFSIFERLVIPAILGKCRAWQEIQDLYFLSFVILKVRNSHLCTVFEGTPLRYSSFTWIVGLTNLAQ